MLFWLHNSHATGVLLRVLFVFFYQRVLYCSDIMWYQGNDDISSTTSTEEILRVGLELSKWRSSFQIRDKYQQNW